MSSLRSALEEWETEDLDQLHIDQLADDLVELERVSGALEAERMRRLAGFERRGGPDRYGYPSPTAFLKHHCRIASGRAHRMVARSRVLMNARATWRAWWSDRISTDQATLLLDQAASLPEDFTEAETTLIAAVAGLSVTDTRRAVTYWRQSVDGPGTELTEIEQMAMRGVSASRTLGGMLRVDAWMTPLAGELFLASLEAHMPPPQPGDTRTPSQRRHDALEDLARSNLDRPDTPTVGGEKPHINVVCDIPALKGIPGGLHETESGEILSIPGLRALACDCSLSRIVIGPNSEIIDVGRRTRTIPAATRRAVIARDRHCTWGGGCDRNARWCDVHHIKHWADGGETEPGNLRLLCRYHHTLTHLLEDQGRAPPPRRDTSPTSSPAISSTDHEFRSGLHRTSRGRNQPRVETPT